MRLIRLFATLAVASMFVTALFRRQMVRVAGHSMKPGLLPGDLLITVPARACLLRLGQVVVVDDPAQPGHQVIKRIHRLIGDRVDVRGDNPHASTDSRTWGPIDAHRVTHIAVCHWPDPRGRLRIIRPW